MCNDKFSNHSANPNEDTEHAHDYRSAKNLSFVDPESTVNRKALYGSCPFLQARFGRL